MGHLVLERLSREDLPAVQAVLDASEGFLVTTTGIPAARLRARTLYRDVPDGVLAADKHILGISDDESRELLGVIDAIIGYPDLQTVTVGLFLVVPRRDRDDVEQSARDLLEEWAREHGASWIRVTVNEASVASLRPWKEACYEPAGEPLREASRLVFVLRKRLWADKAEAPPYGLCRACGHLDSRR